MKDIAHDEAMASVFREDPKYAKAYVQHLLRDGEQDEIEVAIRQLDGESRKLLEQNLNQILSTKSNNLHIQPSTN